VIGDGEAAGQWHPGLADKAHSRLSRGTSRLTPIARDTGANYVVPRMPTAPIAGNNVVHGEIPPVPTTILASISIAAENLKPGQSRLLPRPLYHIEEADHGGEREDLVSGPNLTGIVLHHLSLAPVEQNHRPPSLADIEGIIILI